MLSQSNENLVRAGRGRKKGQRNQPFDPIVRAKGIGTAVTVSREWVWFISWNLWGPPLPTVRRVPRWAWEEVSVDQQLQWVRLNVKRPDKNQNVGPSPVRQIEWPGKDHPLLWEYMTARCYEDGEPRATATLTMFLADDGSWGGTLKDRQNDRALFGRGSTWEEVVESLESQLDGDTPAWRADRTTTGSSRRIKP